MRELIEVARERLLADALDHPAGAFVGGDGHTPTEGAADLIIYLILTASEGRHVRTVRSVRDRSDGVPGGDGRTGTRGEIYTCPSRTLR
jgi:hypothetical protein